MAGLGESEQSCFWIANFHRRSARRSYGGQGGRSSTRKDFQAQDFAGFAFGGDLEGAATNFAVGGEALGGDAGVNH